jgi:signal transduction histidine kinase
MELLGNISPEMASSLYVAVEKKAREDDLLIQRVHNIQLEIARDLHDTIGQNISYLRMKLDYLSETDLRAKTGAKNEIKQMCEVANESYDLMRGTLDVLQSGSSADLSHLLTRHAELVAERTGFEIEITSHGKPKTLPPAMLRQRSMSTEALTMKSMPKPARCGRVVE